MAIGRPIELTPNIATKNISALATDSQTQFTVTGGYRINEIAVYRNGVRLAEGRDFTASDGDTVNLVTAASASDVIEFSVFDSFNISDAIVSAASSQNLNGDFNVTGSLYAGTFEPGELVVGIATFTQLHVGSALTANAAGDVETVGILTAGSFSGDGSALTGLANTDFIVSVATTTGNLNVSAAATITGDLTVSDSIAVTKDINIGAAATITGALTGSTGTFSGAVNVDATTDSTSSTSGSLIVDGGLGVAKNVYIGAGLSVAGTLTYEDVTNVDSVGMVTAKSGVNITGGQLTVGSGITMGIAGVATFSGTSDVHLLDNVKLNVGDASDLQLFHDGSDSYIQDAGTGDLIIKGSNNLDIKSSGDELKARFITNGAVELYEDNSKKFETTNDGTVTTGISTVDGLRLGDSEYISVGAGGTGDLQLSHNGTTSIIKNTTGRLDIKSDSYLYLESDDRVYVGNVGMGEVYAIFQKDGESSLWYDNNKKFATTSNGTVTTGISTVSSSLVVGGNSGVTGSFSNTTWQSSVYNSSGDAYALIAGTTGAAIELRDTATSEAVVLAANGNCNLYSYKAGDDIAFHNKPNGGSITERLRIGAAGISTFSATPHDDKGSLRDIPLRSVTGSAATLVVADAGKVVSTNTTGWTVPASTFSEGDTVSLLNNSAGDLTITCSAVTTYLTSDGSTVTSSTLGTRGMATLYFVSSSVAYLQGTSLS